MAHTNKKFMNLNQNEEYSLDNVQQRINKAVKEHKPVEITTKLDGSMQCANFYEGNFIMTGAQAVSKENSWRLTDGYDMLMQNKFMQTMIRENPLLTFIFDYISLKDAHVVKYTKDKTTIPITAPITYGSNVFTLFLKSFLTLLTAEIIFS